MTRNPAGDDAERLRHLSFWGGPIEVEPLLGGITNRNFRINAAGGTFVARLCEPRERLGIDRRNELVCQSAAHAFGVAPAVAYHENGVLVSDYISARTLTADEVREPSVLRRVAATLKTLHDGWDQLTGEFLYFSAFQTVRTYAETAQSLNACLPDDLAELVEDARRLSRSLVPFTPVLCHNDLLPANVLDDGDRVWLVDWEYAGVGHPLFDLAGLSANCGFCRADDERLLCFYRGQPAADPADLWTLDVFKAVSHLREALWSVIQAIESDLTFDYASYADRNFQAYHDARRRVEIGGA